MFSNGDKWKEGKFKLTLILMAILAKLWMGRDVKLLAPIRTKCMTLNIVASQWIQLINWLGTWSIFAFWPLSHLNRKLVIITKPYKTTSDHKLYFKKSMGELMLTLNAHVLIIRVSQSIWKPQLLIMLLICQIL